MSGPLGSQQWMYSAGGEFYDFPIEQSLRFNDNDSAYLSRTPASAGSLTTWTWSGWVKRGNLGITATLFSTATTNDAIYFGSGASNLVFYTQSNYWGSTAASFRDTSAWYHIVCVWDTTNATAADRLIIYVNNERQSLDYGANPALNATSGFNNNVVQAVGRAQSTANGYFDGYLADVNFIDGQALDPTSFGEFKSGIWIPKDTSGLTFGTNGFRLEYADSAAIGDDTSGNTNDWTVNNLVASDVVLDGVTNNFGVMSSIDKGDGTATYSEGNLKVSVGDNEEAFGSFGMSSGKWYWEIRYVSSAAGNNKIGLGIADTATPNNNEVTNNGHQGTTYAPNDILAVAVDVDNETFSFYKNGTIIETDTDWSAKGWVSIKPIVTSSNSAGEEVCILNFGQDDTFAGTISATGNTDENEQGVFKYTPPSGYLALCSANLPSGAIDTLADETPEDYFNTVLYTGNGTTDTSITSVGFQPSLTWIKQRSGTEQHQLTDAVRGAPLTVSSSGSFAENNNAERLKSFDADGFTLGNDIALNQSSQTYVGWNWKAGGSGVSNTDGDITSSVSVGATSQQNWFSVVSYTGSGTNGDTVGHGLGVAPDMYMIKSRDNARDWRVYHSSLGATKALQLNKEDAANTSSAFWNNTEPTSSVFTIGSVTTVNGSGEDYIAYCFANAEGLCKLGKYTGNGSSDGPMIFTGHRPAFLLIKRTGSSGPWLLWDNKRTGYNGDNDALRPNSNATEYNGSTYRWVDLLSNGFKIIDNSVDFNNNGETFIYLSIASQPFAFANAR
jgi:hypothetical protein